MGQLWWEAARKQFYLCRIFYPGVSWTYFILVQDKDNFFVIGMVARFDREILVFLPCEFCIFHFANVYHTAEQSVVGSAATNINTQPTSFVIQGEVDCMHSWQCCWCIGDPKLGKLRELPKCSRSRIFGENSEIEFLSKVRSSCCSNYTTISLEQFKSNCLNCIMRIAQV